MKIPLILRNRRDFCVPSENAVYRLEESGFGFTSDGARRMFPPRLRRGTRHPDAPPLLASLRKSVRVTP